jgi:dTDP-4-dehydrorhamnose 3,5-epimerase
MSAAALQSPIGDGLDIPECEPGIGDLITSPASASLIDGVAIQPLTIWPDDRGYFAEVFRFGKGLVEAYPSATTQVSCALSYPGTIKAFHYHRRQTDFWAPLVGMFQVGLVDLRQDSRTFGKRNTIYVGQLRSWAILIPPGVGHGYKVIGSDPAVLVYATDRFYDPSDEGRLGYDDARIAYEWETQRK